MSKQKRILFKDIKDSINKQEFIDYWKTHNYKQITEKYGFKYDMIKRFEEYFELEITLYRLNNLRKKTLTDRYGSVKNSYMIRQDKCKHTKLLRYGDENYNNTLKNKATMLERYGHENPSQVPKFVEKARRTTEERYGGIGMASKELAAKTQKTLEERYGVKHNWASKDPKLNGRSTIIEKYGSINNWLQQRTLNTKSILYEKYGDEKYNNRDKAIKTFKERYGSTCYLNSDDRKNRQNNWIYESTQKGLNTKRLRGTFNTSLPEERVYKKLVNMFGIEDVKRQYKTEKYPFQCDFYISSKDLYIECNFFWTHGPHAFEGTENDLQILNRWKIKAQNHKMYTTAIYVWTDLDVRKQKIAKENNLNYLTFYTEQEFDNYAF